MKDIAKGLFQPFKIINRNVVLSLFFIQGALAIGIWFVTSHGLIPGPLKVMSAMGRLATSRDLAENLVASLLLTLQGMFYSILIALVISYLYLIPFFKPLTAFIVKCRYLTLTGLIFLFTLLTSNGHELKIWLLVFGIVPFFVTSLVNIIDHIDTQEFELCKTLKMSNWRALLEIVVIGRLDQVFEVMRQNFAIAWMMITMVEGLSMSEGGLGTMLIKSNKYVDLAAVFAILLIIFALGIICDYILGLLRMWLFPYTQIQTLQ